MEMNLGSVLCVNFGPTGIGQAILQSELRVLAKVMFNQRGSPCLIRGVQKHASTYLVTTGRVSRQALTPSPRQDCRVLTESSSKTQPCPFGTQRQHDHVSFGTHFCLKFKFHCVSCILSASLVRQHPPGSSGRKIKEQKWQENVLYHPGTRDLRDYYKR